MPTRRDCLKTGVIASLSIGAIATVAGCSALPTLGSDRGTNDANWLHEPGEFRENDHYLVGVMGPQTIRSHDQVFGGALIDRMAETYESRFDPPGLDLEDLDRVVTTNVAQIATGSFDETTVTGALEDADYSPKSETSGFTIYANGDPESTTSPIHRQQLRAFAVSGDAVVRVPFFSSEAMPRAVAKELVAINGGDGTRYPEASEAMALLTDELGDGYQRLIRTFDPREHHAPEAGRFEHSVGIGMSRSLSGTTIDDQYVVVYEDEEDVDTGDLERWIDGMAGRGIIPGSLDDTEVSATGRVAVLRGTADANEVSFTEVTPKLTVERAAVEQGRRNETAPEARIEFEVTRTGVALTHVTGDPLGSNTVVYVSNENGEAEATVPSVTDDGQLTAGDTIWVTSGPAVQGTMPDSESTLPAGTEIQVLWRSPSNDRVTLVASHTTT